eukprot:CAMPEP_0203820226 /NCGR_PEP_ID=MMETSP0115-20131106/39016_1 /ASSEMBLY_ACC=CAM_ASM_000227 /TAXON_ID=33651 /ORGANISM="Bicosoecid sp, Strain ms1" /LENGTH=39 /DNA_ID= /DNA_START= /DNA_END= /DNA_ORIENTATION=
MEGSQGSGYNSGGNDSTGGWCWVKKEGDKGNQWLWVLIA